MAAIRTKAWGQQKPALGSQLLPGHRLGRGMQWLTLLNETGGSPRDLIRGDAGTLTNNTAWSPIGGGGLSFDGTDDYVAWSSILPGLNSAVGTFFIRCASINALDASGIVFWGTNTGSSVFFQIPSSASALAAAFGRTVTLSSLVGSNFISSNPQTFVFSSDGTTSGLKIYWNGTLPGQSAGGAPVAFTAGAKSFRLGSWLGGSNWDMSGVINVAGFTSAIWSQADAQWFHAEPYAFIAPPGPRRSYSLPVGGGTITGSGAGTIDAITGTAAGALLIRGSASATLADVAGSAAGAVAIVGASSGTLDAVSGSAASALLIRGAASGAIDAITGAATGTGSTTTTGSSSGTLDAITGSAAGTLAIRGTASATLADVTGTGAGALLVRGAAAGTLASITGTATGTSGVVQEPQYPRLHAVASRTRAHRVIQRIRAN